MKVEIFRFFLMTTLLQGRLRKYLYTMQTRLIIKCKLDVENLQILFVIKKCRQNCRNGYEELLNHVALQVQRAHYYGCYRLTPEVIVKWNCSRILATASRPPHKVFVGKPFGPALSLIEYLHLQTFCSGPARSPRAYYNTNRREYSRLSDAFHRFERSVRVWGALSTWSCNEERTQHPSLPRGTFL